MRRHLVSETQQPVVVVSLPKTFIRSLSRAFPSSSCWTLKCRQDNELDLQAVVNLNFTPKVAFREERESSSASLEKLEPKEKKNEDCRKLLSGKRFWCRATGATNIIIKRIYFCHFQLQRERKQLANWKKQYSVCLGLIIRPHIFIKEAEFIAFHTSSHCGNQCSLLQKKHDLNGNFISLQSFQVRPSPTQLKRNPR